MLNSEASTWAALSERFAHLTELIAACDPGDAHTLAKLIAERGGTATRMAALLSPCPEQSVSRLKRAFRQQQQFCERIYELIDRDRVEIAVLIQARSYLETVGRKREKTELEITA